MAPLLTASQVDAYHDQGFLVVPGFAERGECERLKAAAERIVTSFEPTERSPVFTTTEQIRVADGEFLSSGARIQCFFEEGAFGPDGELARPKELAINKIGHAMHDLDRDFERFTYTPELSAAATAIGLEDALALQSMYIFKQPFIGGEVGCHQDATFLYTDPVTVTGFWFAVEDATLDNGCLWAQPGGHRTALRRLFKRAGPTDADGTVFDTLDASPLPAPGSGALVPLEAETGTLVILHGLLPHWSDVNRSAVSRHAYSVHCVSATAQYPAWNWLTRPESLPLRRLAAVVP